MAKPKVNDLIAKIREAKGNISAVARAYHVSRTAVYQWIATYETAKEALADEREGMVDVAESALYKQIIGGDTTAIIFTLKTLGKSRGYIEKQEVKFTTWQDEIVQLLRDGRIKPEDVAAEFPDLANEFFARAGIHARQ